jgi:hypothetical protein
MEDDIQPNPDMDKALERGGFDKETPKKTKREPVYKKYTDSKVHISKHAGSLWKSRKQQAQRKQSNDKLVDAWDEALRYFFNDHSQRAHSPDSDDGAGARLLDRQLIETENVVFSNTTAMVPALYAKNPVIEITARRDENERLATISERVVNSIIGRSSAPGIALKNKVRRCVVMSTLTNLSWIEIGYTTKDQSSEQANEDLIRLSSELETAKDSKDIERIEGELIALEEKVDVLRPSGPWAAFRRPHDVLVDPNCIEEDLSDANWIMIRDFITTSYIKAVYVKMSKNDEPESIYEPTHVLKLGKSNNSTEHDINTFSLLESNEHEANGFEDKDAYNKALRTEVYYVWDKITRRVYMYHAQDWSWPIWVWDDPLKLDRFFPIYPLTFYTNPEGGFAKGEVTYYLDHQDSINLINTEWRKALQWARRKIIFDKNKVDRADVENFLKGDDDNALGVSIPDGGKLEDVIMSAMPPSTQFMQLFDKGQKLEAISRISSVQEVMRGTQFKTNTTNDAINTYNSQQQTRLDEKIDAIEDFIGAIGWGILQLAFMNMNEEQVGELIGDDATGWTMKTPAEIRRDMNLRVIGGSTQKPTSTVKKREAMEMGQILGQFASASPVAIVVALKVFERAFDEITITAEDWEMVRKSIESQMQGAGGEQPNANAQLEEVLRNMPPEAQQAVKAAVDRGVPPEKAVELVAQQMQQQQQPPQ